MSRVLTTDGLIRSVRTRGSIPSDTSTYTDEVVIDVLNEEIDVGLLTSILSNSEEYLVSYKDIPIVADTTRYKIPYRAIGNKLRDVFLLDNGSNFYECTRISLEENADYTQYNSASYTNLNQFYVENDSIVFVNNALSNFTHVRMYFYLRPNRLVLEEHACKITNINRTTGIISVNNVPADFSSLPLVDFIANKTPNKIISYDNTITSISSTTNPKTITIPLANIPDELEVGDWICQAEETPIANIPTEWQPVLAQRTAVFFMESMGDTEGLNNAKAKLAQMEKSVIMLTDSRVEGAPQKIKNRNGLLNSKSFFRFRR